MSAVTANMVADYFLYTAHDCGDLLTNLKLQKLVYYAQAWHLALYDEPLFEEHFEAWIHGPVQPELYRRFREYGWDRIGENPDKPKLSQLVKDLLDEILNIYDRFTARDLERMTHREEPWIEARDGAPIEDPSNNTISTDTMSKYFKTRLANG